ncbi:uncharacterized protein [Parasteatoda tepidariorum]|uniref:uncharacterized protein n=1 Tax=Parasteatoda tepidariorum TaxID=114398 RepID=UPI0039BC3445
MGIHRSRTTSYHPQTNGLIEELHRPLKTAIKCFGTEKWTAVLPLILLGFRTAFKEDIGCTPAELVFGTTVRLPGELLVPNNQPCDPTDFVNKLRQHMQSLRPTPPKRHGDGKVFVHPDLTIASHVFLRQDMVRRPLQPPYSGPFKVLRRSEKVFYLDINGKTEAVSIDRVKPAYILYNSEQGDAVSSHNLTPPAPSAV